MSIAAQLRKKGNGYFFKTLVKKCSDFDNFMPLPNQNTGLLELVINLLNLLKSFFFVLFFFV